jgi:hypothetical protein
MEPVHEAVIRAVATMREAFSSAGLPTPDHIGYTNKRDAVDVVRRIVLSDTLVFERPVGDFSCDEVVILDVTIGHTKE